MTDPDVSLNAINEREAFEAWLDSEFPSGCISDMERGWMARAALASAARPPITYAPPSPTLGVAHSGPGTSAAAPKAAPAPQPPACQTCQTCNDIGMIGGPSYYAPDEGGVPCPDCSAPQPPVAVQEPAAWRLTNTAFRKPRFEYYDTKEQAERRQADFNRAVDGGLHNLTPLYTHPAPAAQWDALDAERLNYLIENRAIVANDPDSAPGYWLEFISQGADRWVQIGEHPTPRAAIDAARATKEGDKPCPNA